MLHVVYDLVDSELAFMGQGQQRKAAGGRERGAPQARGGLAQDVLEYRPLAAGALQRMARPLPPRAAAGPPPVAK